MTCLLNALASQPAQHKAKVRQAKEFTLLTDRECGSHF